MDYTYAEPLTLPAMLITDEMFIEDIVIGDRYRKDLGDITPLVESIRTIGLLHPIVVSTDNRLVAGERRLTAMRELGWSKAPVRRISIDAIVIGEHDENEVRKDFTPSERVAIARVVAQQMGERRGNGNVDNSPQFKGEKTRDIAAERSGFSSGKQFERAKAVTDTGVPELVEAMDTGKVSIAAAAVAAKVMTPAQQRSSVEDGTLAKAVAEYRRAEVRKKEAEAIIASTPKFTPEQEVAIKKNMGSREDGDIYSRIDEALALMFEQPDPDVAAQRIPLSLAHAIDTKAIRRAAQWMIDFSAIWDEKGEAA